MGVASHHYLFQSYGLVERLLDEGNQMHMAVRIYDLNVISHLTGCPRLSIIQVRMVVSRFVNVFKQLT